MKKDAKTLKKAAQNCSRFDTGEYSGTSAKNSTGIDDEPVSCKNCTHYEPTKVCSLNLYEEIINNHNF